MFVFPTSVSRQAAPVEPTTIHSFNFKSHTNRSGMGNGTPLERMEMRRDQLLACERERESEGDLVAVHSNASMCGPFIRGSMGW